MNTTCRWCSRPVTDAALPGFCSPGCVRLARWLNWPDVPELPGPAPQSRRELERPAARQDASNTMKNKRKYAIPLLLAALLMPMRAWAQPSIVTANSSTAYGSCVYGTTCTVKLPGTWGSAQNGDLVVIHLTTAQASVSSLPPSPDNYTCEYQSTSADSAASVMACYEVWQTGDSTSPVFTWTGSNGGIYSVYTVTGENQSAPIDTNGGTVDNTIGATTLPYAASSLTLTGNDLVLLLGGLYATNVTTSVSATAPSGYSALLNSGTGGYWFLDYDATTAAGTLAAQSATNISDTGGAIGKNAGITLAIAPGAAPTPTPTPTPVASSCTNGVVAAPGTPGNCWYLLPACNVYRVGAQNTSTTNEYYVQEFNVNGAGPTAGAVAYKQLGALEPNNTAEYATADSFAAGVWICASTTPGIYTPDANNDFFVTASGWTGSYVP